MVKRTKLNSKKGVMWDTLSDIKVCLFGALPIDTLKIKHSEKLKEISFRHVLENTPEKSKHNGMEIAKLPDYCLGSYFTKDTSQKT